MNITEQAATVLQEIDAELAICEKATEGSKEPCWWCPECLREVSPQMVRYDETHDGCGASVELHESTPRTLLPASLRCLKTAIEGLLPLVRELDDIPNSAGHLLTTLTTQWKENK